MTYDLRLKTKIITLFFLLWASVAVAADDYRLVSLQVMKPAKQPVSFTGRSPAIYAVLYATGTRGETHTFRNDSLHAVAAAIGVKETLEEIESLADYDVPVYNFYSFCTDTVSCADSVEAITENDLLIIVKNVTVTPFQRVEKRVSELSYDNYFNVGSYAVYTASFEVYDTITRTFSHRETLSDTLVWDKNALNATEALSELPSTAEAAQLAAAEAGKLYARRLAPYWLTVQRFFYVPSYKNMEQAAAHAENAEWSEAMKIWEQYAGHNNRKTAAQAAFNMALACEVNGDYELSLEWLQYAEKSYPISAIAGYRAVLQRRLNESAILEKQLQDL
ncbi:MAG: DUF6340 family protein [Prevotellaceae bacterium]|jgi:hypothetical protein|nr:DUF6340 family protein [Prevotellaceae bacterium]